MTLLGALNFLVLQWFCVRLAKCVDDQGRVLRWVWFKRVWPLTGWWGEYRRF